MSQPPKMVDIEELLANLEVELDALHKQQSQKAKKLAHRLRPDLTDEDLLNPDNFKQIINDPDYMYEDGLAAGILSAKIALRAWVRGRVSGTR